MQLPGLWRARMAVVVTGVALTAVLAGSGPARAAAADEARLLELTNGLRASVGAPALTLDEALSGVARGWATRMAAAGGISHNPNLTSQVGSWSKVAENVGMGPDLDTVHRTLVASRSHYLNLVDTEVTLIGIGVVRSGGHVFVVENFLRRAGAAPAPAAPTATTPTTRPAAPASPPARPRVTVVPVRAPLPAARTTVATAGPPPAEPPSPWLALALEVTRAWERATG